MNYNRKVLALLICFVSAVASAQGTRLLRSPAVSRDLVAFTYASDVWVVSRAGGVARRLTSTASVEAEPHFSPDGSLIAYSATVGGNMDVYVVPTAGGEPQRLTYYPGPDAVRGWTPDGKRVIFASGRTGAPTPYFKLWTIGLNGGLPEALPMPRAYSASVSPDGQRVAYEEISTIIFPQWAVDQSSQWRHYRGGRTHPISIMTLANYTVEKLPWKDSNDSYPMWVGNNIYFLSDRSNSMVNLFVWRGDTKTVTQLTHHDDFDIMNASAGPDAIVYEQAGYIHLFDIKEGRSHQLNIDVKGDLPWARAQFKTPSIQNAALSPTGAHVAFEAHGKILVGAVDKPDYRNLTQKSSAHDRSPTWSPDGSQLAWLSDETGEYQLLIGQATGFAKPRVVALPSSAFYSALEWSPDGKSIRLEDNRLNLWTLSVATGKFTKVATDLYDDSGRDFHAVWSPDSRWIAYTAILKSHMRAIMAYSMATEKTIQLTDGLADAVWPAFDANGKYLYFLASTNSGPGAGTLDMSTTDKPTTWSIYLAVLSATEPSPFLPAAESAEEPGAAVAVGPGRQRRDTAAVTVRIDAEGIGQRILALNVPAGEYRSVAAGPPGTFFYLSSGAGGRGRGGAGGGTQLEQYRVAAQRGAAIH